MKIMRGKTFEGKSGHWEKIEIELDSSDLLPEELEAPKSVQPVLLEIRAEKHLLLFMVRHGKLTQAEVDNHVEELNDYKKKILGPKKLKIRDKNV